MGKHPSVVPATNDAWPALAGCARGANGVPGVAQGAWQLCGPAYTHIPSGEPSACPLRAMVTTAIAILPYLLMYSFPLAGQEHHRAFPELSVTRPVDDLMLAIIASFGSLSHLNLEGTVCVTEAGSFSALSPLQHLQVCKLPKK
eukprot:scaffold52385_cov43-Prasinocladus_malaysianus.AAC.1